MTRRRPGKWRPVVLAVGVGLLAVVAVFLVLAAFQVNRFRGETFLEASPSSAGETGVQTPLATTPESAEPSTTPSAAATSRIADAQILRMFDSEYGYRAVRASCGAPGAMIERTTDGGVTWTRMDLGSPGPQVIVAVRIVDADQTDAVVRQSGDCSVSVSSSFTGGEFWAALPERIAEQAYPDPVAPTNIHVGDQTLAAPCTGVVDVWSDPSGVVALCPGQVVRYGTADAVWKTIATGDVLAAAVDGATGSGLALVAGVQGCEGLRVLAFDVAGTTNPLVCLEDGIVGDRATLAVTGAQAWLWSGAGVLKSDDGGLTWARVS